MATTTPNYGWDVPTSTDYVADGAVAIETLGDDIDATLWTALGGNYPGLRLVKKQTIGTGVASVTVTGAFSSTYDNYKIVLSNGTGSADTYFNLTLGATTSGYKYVYTHVGYGSTSPYYESSAAAAAWVYMGTSNTTDSFTDIDLQSPNVAKSTAMRRSFANNGVSGWVNGFLPNTTQYTAFTFTPASGTLTGGTIYVYGYGMS
jgi:hypothetical protein